jgi:endoribonuclease Dicer
VTYHSLGPYGAELFLYHEMKHRIAQFTNQAESEMDYMTSVQYENHTQEVELPEELRDMVTVLEHCKSWFEDEDDPDTVPTRIEPKWCSPKVIRLSHMLFEYYSPTFQGIVFVEQRHVAMCLSKMLPRIPPLELYFKSAQLIGHGAGNVQRSNTRGMALRTQRDVVEMFRHREINIC